MSLASFIRVRLISRREIFLFKPKWGTLGMACRFAAIQFVRVLTNL